MHKRNKSCILPTKALAQSLSMIKPAQEPSTLTNIVVGQGSAAIIFEEIPKVKTRQPKAFITASCVKLSWQERGYKVLLGEKNYMAIVKGSFDFTAQI